MSSILTNTSAMTALQTLRSININLARTQDEISTGKSVGTAKQNAAVWAISKVMESDVKGFKGIADSLALGESTVAVARKASETVSDLLADIKSKIISAQQASPNDRAKYQADVKELREQILSVVNAAQFNGQNLLLGTEDMMVLSSLDRLTDNTVKASSITVLRQDMSADAGVYGTGTALTANFTAAPTSILNDASTATVTAAGTITTADTFTVNIAGSTLSLTGYATAADAGTGIAAAINALGLQGVTATNAAGVVTVSNARPFESVALSSSATGSATAVSSAATIAERAESYVLSSAALVNEGDGYRISFGSATYTYIAGKGENMEDVARGLKTAVDGGQVAGITTQVMKNSAGAWVLQIDSATTDYTGVTAVGAAGGKASGGLFGLGNLDVTTTTGAKAALGNVETLIQNAIDAAAAFGSAQGRIEIQSSFISSIVDSLRTGIGAMVDADMEEASARLQALQVQQQLGVQSLSIANQAPQSILSLFR